MNTLAEVKRANTRMQRAREARNAAIVRARDVDHQKWKDIADACGMTVQGVIKTYKTEQQLKETA